MNIFPESDQRRVLVLWGKHWHRCLLWGNIAGQKLHLMEASRSAFSGREIDFCQVYFYNKYRGIDLQKSSGGIWESNDCGKITNKKIESGGGWRAVLQK